MIWLILIAVIILAWAWIIWGKLTGRDQRRAANNQARAYRRELQMQLECRGTTVAMDNTMARLTMEYEGRIDQAVYFTIYADGSYRTDGFKKKKSSNFEISPGFAVTLPPDDWPDGPTDDAPHKGLAPEQSATHRRS